MSEMPYSDYAPECAADFIAQWEGFRGKAYQCAAGVWTIGFGHTGTVSKGDRITREQAYGCLISDIRSAMMGLGPYVKRDVTLGQFIALTSLAFNIGALNVVQKCPKLMRALNVGDYEAAGKEFLDVTGGGPGLVGRRRREYALFMG